MNFKKIFTVLLFSASASSLIPFDSAMASKRVLDTSVAEEGNAQQSDLKKIRLQGFPTQKEFVSQLIKLHDEYGHLDQPLEEFGPMISRAISFFKGKIAVDDDRQKILDAMAEEATQLAQGNALTLDHLNFYTFKLMMISKPDFAVKYDYFRHIGLFRDLGDAVKQVFPELTGDGLHPWKGTYQENLFGNTVVGQRLQAFKEEKESEFDGFVVQAKEILEKLTEIESGINSSYEDSVRFDELLKTHLEKLNELEKLSQSKLGKVPESDESKMEHRADELTEKDGSPDNQRKEMLETIESHKRELKKVSDERKLVFTATNAETENGIAENTHFRYNFLEVSKRGMSVVPFFQERPIYTLENYIELFIRGIYLAGASTSDVCSVHTDLIDDPVSVYYHDILHLQGLAPSADAAINKAHMDKMREVASVLWAEIKKHDKESVAYKQGKSSLFALLHELSQYKKSNLLNAGMTNKQAFDVMMQNARSNVSDIFLSGEVVDRLSYYKAMIRNIFSASPEVAPKITSIKEEVIDAFGNEAFSMAYNFGDILSYTYSTTDHLQKYENARKFSYQIALLLKWAGLCPTLSLDSFTHGVGYQKFSELLDTFDGTYAPLFAEAVSENPAGEGVELVVQ